MNKTTMAMAFCVTLFATCANAQAGHLGGVRARACDPGTYDHVLIRLPLVAPCDPVVSHPTTIGDDGVAFEWGATITFAAYSMNTSHNVTHEGWIWVRLRDRGDVLIPYYMPQR